MVLAHTSSLDCVVTCGVHCLELFVQLNWTGPPIDGLQEDMEALLTKDGAKLLNQQARSALGSDGEVSLRGSREQSEGEGGRRGHGMCWAVGWSQRRCDMCDINKAS